MARRRRCTLRRRQRSGCELPATLTRSERAAEFAARHAEADEVPIYWRTRAERSTDHVTPDYDETLRYLRHSRATRSGSS